LNFSRRGGITPKAATMNQFPNQYPTDIDKINFFISSKRGDPDLSYGYSGFGRRISVIPNNSNPKFQYDH